jgi:hypothetical protein
MDSGRDLLAAIGGRRGEPAGPVVVKTAALFTIDEACGAGCSALLPEYYFCVRLIVKLGALSA